MPTLQFKGKNIIWNHHLSVPYHTLEEIGDLNFQPEKANGNLIVEGDNLLALKALLPHYAGKVKCIYIDPPYNTGNEGWIYNDSVNSPMLKEWLGKEVSKDDLTKHDKWLCMMTPRLKLLRELLADDGVFFISIGDDEDRFLSVILSEIFGEEYFVAKFVWKSRAKPTNAGDAKYRPQKVAEYILTYSKKNPEEIFFNLYSGEERKYPFSDKDGKYRLTSILTSNRGMFRRETMRFEINGFKPDDDQRWKAGKEIIEELHKTNRLFFDDQGFPSWKKYDYDEDELLYPLYTYVNEDLSGTAEIGKSELNDLLGKFHGFDTVKPVQLIKYLINITNTKDSIILDSFAGSGTTMHAVIELNKEDGGQRQCIMVQMTEATPREPEKNICRDITRERVKRAIEKYGYDSGFKYLRVGIPIDAETLLAGELPTYQQFAEYVYYLCTGESLKNKSRINEKTYYVGEHGSSVIYLIYKQNFEELTHMALNLQLAEEISARHPLKRRIIYAPACFLEEDYMKDKAIEYVGIPYNLFRRAGE